VERRGLYATSNGEELPKSFKIHQTIGTAKNTSIEPLREGGETVKGDPIDSPYPA